MGSSFRESFQPQMKASRRPKRSGMDIWRRGGAHDRRMRKRLRCHRVNDGGAANVMTLVDEHTAVRNALPGFSVWPLFAVETDAGTFITGVMESVVKTQQTRDGVHLQHPEARVA